MRKRWLQRGAILGFLLIAAMQLVQPETPVARPATKPPAWENPELDSRVAGILKRACSNCHSNETQWPWYARISPASWLMNGHVQRGREQLNLSYSWSIDDNEKGEIADAVASGAMPPPSYLLLHSEARVSDAERKLIWDWATGNLAPAASK